MENEMSIKVELSDRACHTESMKTKDAIKHFGNGNRLAKALGISRQAIDSWGEDVPPLRAWELEAMTGGALKKGKELEVKERP